MRVGVVQRARKWPQEGHHFLELHLPDEPVGKSPSFDELHDKEGDACFLSEVEDVEDVRVFEPCN